MAVPELDVLQKFYRGLSVAFMLGAPVELLIRLKATPVRLLMSVVFVSFSLVMLGMARRTRMLMEVKNS